MTLLSWPTALLIGAIAVPLLLLLYFLKLRRQERRVSSTLLWRKAVQDLQVNAPFQKLRRNLLLFLQLLVLAAVLFGLADPVANLRKTQEKSVVILIDRSGSMNTIEADGRSRLDHAKDAAAQFVAGLSGGSRAMVVSFADRAAVVGSFTDDKRRLEHLIRDIEPTGGPSHIAEALQLAVAYSSSFVDVPGASTPEAAQQGAAEIELFSDGRISDADKQFVSRGHVNYYRVGEVADNVGIVAFDVRRDFERPGILSVFAQIENFGSQPVKSDVTLELDGHPIGTAGSVREVSLGPAIAASQPSFVDTKEAQPASQNVVFEIEHQAGGVLTVTWQRPDALMMDNKVTAPIDPPRPVRVLAVTDRPAIKFYLERAPSDLGINEMDVRTTKEYEAMPDSKISIEGRSAYDLVIFDDYSTDRLPPGNYLFFGGIPKIEGVSIGADVTDQPIVFGRETHPLLHSVNYDSLHIADWKRLTLPKSALPLLEGEDSVVMALYGDAGHRYVIAAFDLMDSYFPLTVAFPVFLQNVVMFMAGGDITQSGHMTTPGETFSLTVPPGSENAKITRPDGGRESVDVRGRATASYARTREPGLYNVAYDDPRKTADSFAVNLLDETESHIAPNSTLTIGAEAIAAKAATSRVNEALWPYAAAVALAFVLLEWWVYNRRVMI